jgi:hypothetical protein
MSEETKYWQTKNFQKLQELWRKKLESAGFQDIEQPENFKSGVKDGNLKQWTTSRHLQGKGLTPEYIAEKTEYYRLAGQFFWEHKFKNHVEATVWELHANGTSIRNIVKEMRRRGETHLNDKTLNKRVVHETIQSLAKTMKESVK